MKKILFLLVVASLNIGAVHAQAEARKYIAENFPGAQIKSIVNDTVFAPYTEFLIMHITTAKCIEIAEQMDSRDIKKFPDIYKSCVDVTNRQCDSIITVFNQHCDELADLRIRSEYPMKNHRIRSKCIIEILGEDYELIVYTQIGRRVNVCTHQDIEEARDRARQTLQAFISVADRQTRELEEIISRNIKGLKKVQ